MRCRFPRRAESAALFETEAPVHELVSRFLPSHVAIPRVELIGQPGRGFPYEFAGHRFIPGEPADATEADLLPVLACEIGTLLGAIHAVPADLARAAGIAEATPSDEGRNQWVERCLNVLPALRGTDPRIEQAITWVMQESPLIRRFGGPLRLIHQDLSPEHLIVDPQTGRLKGVLD
ncbi:MAG: phosphotransferase family protein, partial [Longimicrobiales bacterium]